MALLAHLLGPFLLLCSDLRFLEIALVLLRGWRLSTALDPALTRLPPPRDCQRRRTLLCLYSSSRLPESVNYLEPYSARTPAPLRLSSASEPPLTEPKSPRDCQLPQTLLCSDSRLPKIFKCLRICSKKVVRLPEIVNNLGPRSGQSPASPKLSSVSEPTLPRFPPPQYRQMPWALLCPNSRLPKIVNYLGTCSAQTHASAKLTTASGPTLLRFAPS